jgi:excisionase family DNA binding protein
MERLIVTVPEAAQLLGVSRMTAYSAVREGSIPSVRIGRRLLVPKAALERLLTVAEPIKACGAV